MIAKSLSILGLIVLLGAGGPLFAQQWESLGPNDANWPSVGSSYYHKLVLDRYGRPVVMSLDYGYGGTYRVQRWDGAFWQVLDSSGFFADGSSLSNIVLDESDNPVIAGSDLEFGDRLTVKRWNGTEWTAVGMSGFSMGRPKNLSIAKDDLGNLLVAYADEDNDDRVSVQKWDGASWEFMGLDGFTNENSYRLELALDRNGYPLVAYNDWANGHHTKVQRWTGTDWELLDMSTFPLSNVGDREFALDANDNPMLAIRITAYGNLMTVLRWDGNEWAPLGPIGFSEGQSWVHDFGLGVDGSPTLLYTDQSLGTYLIKRWNGNDWELECVLDTTGGVRDPVLAFDAIGDKVVAYQAQEYGWRTMVQEWDGSGWRVYGEEGISTRQANHTSLAINESGGVWVVYNDFVNQGRATVQNWNGEDWELVGPAGFSTFYSLYNDIVLDAAGYPVVAGVGIGDGPGISVVRWNGSSWVLVGSAGISNGSVKGLRLALDANDNPMVAYLRAIGIENFSRVDVKGWSGSDWVEVAPSPSTWASSNLAFELDSLDHPIIGYQSVSSGGPVIRRWNGGAWDVLDPTYQALSSFYGLKLDVLGNALYAQNGSNGLTVRRRVEATWVDVCSLSDHSGGDVDFELDNNGNPVIGYTNNGRATVIRWDGAEWELVGTERFTTSFQGSTGSGWLQVDGQGSMVVAYASGAMYAKAFSAVATSMNDIGDSLMAGSTAMNISPNPNFGNELQLYLSGLPTTLQAVQVELSDLSGRRVSAQQLPAYNGEVNSQITLPPGLASGVYVVTAVIGDACWTARLVVAN